MTFDRDRLPDWGAYADREGILMHGRGKWRNVLCDFHDDTTPSMRVNTESGGWVCMSCGASGGDVLAHYMRRHGIDFVQAARDLGAWVDDGKPARQPYRVAGLTPRDALQLVAEEAMVFAIVAADIARGKQVSAADRDRALVAAGRIAHVVDWVRA